MSKVMKSKKDPNRITRRPKQKGKIKKSKNKPSKTKDTKRAAEREIKRLLARGINPTIAKNVGGWRSRHLDLP